MLKVIKEIILIGIAILTDIRPNKSISLSSENSRALNTQINTEVEREVFSYKQILLEYYKDAMKYRTQNNKQHVTFDEFCDKYYTSNMRIHDYTEAIKLSDNSVLTNRNDEAIIFKGQRQDKDAEYILDGEIYEYTPLSLFKEMPTYFNRSIYDLLEVGDIIYETRTIFFNAGHNAVITDLDKKDENNNSYIETIEAVWGGVQHGYLDDDRITRYGVKILRVDHQARFVTDVLSFLNTQLKKTYNLNILRSNTDIDSTCWYCSELVWAAYLYAGTNLCYQVPEVGQECWPLPAHIYQSSITYELTIPFGFLELELINKIGNTWYIQLFNPNGFSITASYNKKMCMFNDAANWLHLNDIEEIVMQQHCYIQITIKENWFATSITTSWCTNDRRYISYADNLRLSDHSILVRNGIIDL